MRCPGEGPPEYSEADLQILSGLEHIRRRPGMYLGGTDTQSLHHMLFELVNEALAPNEGTPATDVRVTLGADGFVEVRDNRTPPADLETAFGPIHTGGHGIWPYPIANALSEELTARVRTPGAVSQCTFRRGQLDAAAQFDGPPDDRGLTIRFRPDPDIFGAAQFDPGTVRTRLQQCAFLHSGVRITFVNESNGAEDVFEYADGVAEYVKRLNANRTPLHPEVISIRGESGGIRYDVGLQWCREDEEVCVSGANNWFTPHGGTHVNGFRNGYSRALREVVREHAPQWPEPQAEELRRGLTAFIVVKLQEPRFESQTRSRLVSTEVEGIVRAGVHQQLRDHLAGVSGFANQIIRAAHAARTRK